MLEAARYLGEVATSVVASVAAVGIILWVVVEVLVGDD